MLCWGWGWGWGSRCAGACVRRWRSGAADFWVGGSTSLATLRLLGPEQRKHSDASISQGSDVALELIVQRVGTAEALLACLLACSVRARAHDPSAVHRATACSNKALYFARERYSYGNTEIYPCLLARFAQKPCNIYAHWIKFFLIVWIEFGY